MEGNASVYQVNPVSRTTGEGRAEILRTWGADFDQKGGGGLKYIRMYIPTGQVTNRPSPHIVFLCIYYRIRHFLSSGYDEV